MSPVWKRDISQENSAVTSNEDSALEDICQLVLIHVVNRREIYTMAQLTATYDDIRSQYGLSSCRSTDLKQKLQAKFGTRLIFQRGTQCNTRSSEFVFPEGVEFTASCVQSSLLGGGIAKSVSLKNTARTIHESIKATKEILPWPPTPQDIIGTEPYINTDLYNELAWIVDPEARLNDEGRVQISHSKATKLHQLCQDIQTLLPKSQPSLDQVLLSLTMHRKTGSSGVVDTMHSLGYGISYTETVFVEDKWAEWSERQHSDIPSNITKGLPTTHIADNIDWKNKELSGTRETHNTNSILVQHKLPCPDLSKSNSKAKVSVTPDYSFKREDHRSFKSKRSELPQYIGKKACFQTLEYEQSESHPSCEKAQLETLAWAKIRRPKDNHPSTAQTTEECRPTEDPSTDQTTDECIATDDLP
ncbi:MAG: hypothetical protein ABW185_07780 [Sedimenticola sp.]